MRIASKTVYENIISNLNTVYSDMARAQETVSTSKRINKLSDDPVSLVTVLDLRSSLSNIDQLNRNVSMGKSWLTSSESALTQVNNILTDVKALTVQMSSSTTGSSQRANASGVIQQNLEQIISLANSKTGGRSIFAGTDTDKTPFSLNAAGDQVGYSGNDTAFSINMGSGSKVAVGKVGADVFGENWDSSNIFKSIIDLKTALQNNDISGIQTVMGNLDQHISKISAEISEVGGKSNSMEVKENIIADLKLNYTDRKSSLEDADIAQAVIDLNVKQLAYNAALTSASKVMQLSLVDFMR
jgi:flagellar hook-associated protein 3 FlgL